MNKKEDYFLKSSSQNIATLALNKRTKSLIRKLLAAHLTYLEQADYIQLCLDSKTATLFDLQYGGDFLEQLATPKLRFHLVFLDRVHQVIHLMRSLLTHGSVEIDAERLEDFLLLILALARVECVPALPLGFVEPPPEHEVSAEVYRRIHQATCSGEPADFSLWEAIIFLSYLRRPTVSLSPAWESIRDQLTADTEAARDLYQLIALSQPKRRTVK